MPAILSPPRLVSADEANAILGVTVGSLAVWRCTRRYALPYCKIGRRVKYKLEDIERFIASRTVGGGNAD